MLPSDLYGYRINSKADLKTENNEKHNMNTKNLDKEHELRSSEGNLIDLLNDVHLTPQKTHANDKEIADYQLKMLEEFCTTSALTRKHNEMKEEEFRSFFDKYEYNNKPETSSLKLEDLRVFEQNTNSIQRRFDACAFDSGLFADKLSNTIHDVNSTPKRLVPKEEPELENGEINEDLIDEVMFEQQLEKQQLGAALDNNTNEIKTSFVEISRTPNIFIDSKKPKEDYSNIFNEIITRNKVKYFKTLPVRDVTPNSNTAKLTSPVISGYSKDNKMKTKLEQKTLTEELVTKYDIKYLEAVKKIEKTFLKRNVLKSDAEKAKLTPGPSLYEKTVILPQMMQRLKARQIDDKSTMKMKLILDEGPSCTKLSDNNHCNIESPINVHNTKQSQQEKNIIKLKLIQNARSSCSTFRDPQNSIKICPVASMETKSDLKTSVSNSLSVNKAIETPFIKQSIKNDLKMPVSVNLDDITVLRPPKVLMSDCNKHRLIASETGKLFNNFVRGGSYYAP